MKILGFIAAILVFSVISLFAKNTAPAKSEASQFTIDSVHSSVLFSVKHYNVGKFYGRFNEVKGNFNYDASAPEKSSVEATIPTASVDTNSKGRDKHLRSADFFSAKEFPEIHFKSGSVKSMSENQLEIEGNLTLRGITKKIKAIATKTGEGPGRKGKSLIGFEVKFSINRNDFGVKYGAGVLSDQVDIILAIEAAKN